MRCTELALTPAASAIAAPVRCVASLGGSSMVSATTRSATEGSSFGMREGLVLSCKSPVHAFGGEPFLPAPDAGLGFAGLAHDRVRADASGAEQHDLRPPNVLLGRVAVLNQSAEPIELGGRDGNGNPSAHAADSHAPSPPGIPTGIQMSDAIH